LEGTLDVEIEAKTVRLKPKEILLVSPEKIIKSKIFLTTLNFWLFVHQSLMMKQRYTLNKISESVLLTKPPFYTVA
jgi:hypothetical protein